MRLSRISIFPAYPLANAHQRETYRVAVGLLWEYVLSTDRFGVLETLTESEIGNPVRIWRNGKLVSSDLAHSVRERNMLLEASESDGDEALCVAELGAGYGRLAEVFGRTTNYRYMIFDITPALYVSQSCNIKRIFPEEKIFEFRHFDLFSEIESELNESRFAFFTANQIELMPDRHLRSLHKYEFADGNACGANQELSPPHRSTYATFFSVSTVGWLAESRGRQYRGQRRFCPRPWLEAKAGCS